VKKKLSWFWVAVLSVALLAPNNTVIRIGVNEADPYYWILVRSLAIAVVCLPFVLRDMHKIQTALKDTFIAAATFSFAIVSYTVAIYLSSASYTAIITLLSPILFVVISSYMFKEKISRRSVAGVSLAMAGAMALVVLPVAMHQNTVAFYPLATLLTFLQCFAYVLGTIYMRKANEDGVSMGAVIGVTALVTVVISSLLFTTFGDYARTPTGGSFWLAVLYSGIIATCLARALNVLSYEHVGAVPIAALTYLETFVAILIPVFVLGETLSSTMVIGGILILLGVFIVERHDQAPVKHRTINCGH
jgi:drug/metabolite transporter (DMT)-like permease